MDADVADITSIWNIGTPDEDTQAVQVPVTPAESRRMAYDHGALELLRLVERGRLYFDGERVLGHRGGDAEPPVNLPSGVRSTLSTPSKK